MPTIRLRSREAMLAADLSIEVRRVVAVNGDLTLVIMRYESETTRDSHLKTEATVLRGEL